jgi:peroxiredoxin
MLCTLSRLSLKQLIRTSGARALSVGDQVPQVVFQTRARVGADGSGGHNPFDWKDSTSADYFAGKRVVLFGLPGAFTPTCSSEQLPGYQEHYETIKSHNIDDVYCLSVNCAFVMYQWGKHEGLVGSKEIGSLSTDFEKVKLIPDGAAQFTRGMDMSCTWTSNRGFGERSWRYSAVIDNGVLEQIFVEAPRLENSDADPYEVSDALTMVEYLRSQ